MTDADGVIVATYNLRLVILSVVTAVIASYTALNLAGRTAQGQARKLWLAGGAIALGIGIWFTHLIAILAYKLSMTISYDLWLVLISMAVAIFIPVVALLIVTYPKMNWLLPLGGVFVGLGIVLVHYTSMKAMRLEAVAEYDLKLMAVLVVITIAAFMTALWLGIRWRTDTTEVELQKFGNAIVMGSAIVGIYYVAMATVRFKPTAQSAWQSSYIMDNSLLADAIGVGIFSILTPVLLTFLFEQRKGAETARSEALKQSEQRFRTLVQNASNIIAIVAADGTASYVSPSTQQILGHKPEEWLGKQGHALIHPDDFGNLTNLLTQSVACPAVILSDEVRLQHEDGSWRDFEVIVNNLLSEPSVSGIVTTYRDITDRKRSEVVLQRQAERERLQGVVAQRIRQSLNLSEILSTTVAEVRQLLQADRVVAYRFNPDWSGYVAVESIDRNCLSILGTSIQDLCFANGYTQLYAEGRVQAVEDIYTAGLDQCQIDMLAELQVKANLVVPVLQGEELWGLLIAHQCTAPRQWQPWEIDLLQQLATQVAIAIQQSQLYEQVQSLNADLEHQVQERTVELRQAFSDLEHQVQERTAELRQAFSFGAMLKRITDRVRDSLDEKHILQAAVRELAFVLGAKDCNAAMYDLERKTSTVCYEYASLIPPFQGHVAQMEKFPQIYQQLLQGQFFQFCSTIPYPTRGLVAMLVCPILDDQGVLGDLWLINQKEYAFSDLEIRLVQQVANQCAIAIRQARLYQAVQTQVQELERLNRLKDDFVNTVSHELRAPMTNIKMAIQMLTVTLNQFSQGFAKLTPAESSKATRYLQILQAECDREISLINDLLDLQRLDAGVQSIELETIQLEEFIPQVVKPFQERVQNRQQTLQIDLLPELPPLVSNPTNLERILAELLNNACKYTPPGGDIIVSVRSESIATQLKVLNSGVEIPASELPRIFDKFYRVPSTDPWRQSGTGLGLSLVQKLTKQLGGSIRVESASSQTCFTIELPNSLD